MKNQFKNTYSKVKHLTRPKPWLYWGDLLGTALCCYGFMYACFQLQWSDPWKWVSYLLCGFFANRGIYFMHEVFHQGKHLRGFELAQNLLFGCVFKYPSYIHFPHHHHHNAATYGTEKDPEYDSSWIGKRWGNYVSILPVSLIWSVLQFVRFGILPLLLPIMGRKNREAIYQKASTFAMNPAYKRPLYNKKEFWSWITQDTICFGINCALIYLVYRGNMSIGHFLLVQSFGAFFFVWNFYRALVAHRYSSNGRSMSLEQQLEDSISIPSSFSDFFWAPVGLKYHSLHHYIPTIPYHNLSKAHRILLEAGDQSYRKSLEPSFELALYKAMSGHNNHKVKTGDRELEGKNAA